MVKSNKLFKILTVVLIVLAIISFSTMSNAAIPSISITASQPTGLSTNTITDVGNSVLWIIQAVGIAAGVIIVAYMGIKYITSSPDGKAEIKKQAYVYILGAAFLILAPTIANIVFTTVDN